MHIKREMIIAVLSPNIILFVLNIICNKVALIIIIVMIIILIATIDDVVVAVHVAFVPIIIIPIVIIIINIVIASYRRLAVISIILIILSSVSHYHHVSITMIYFVYLRGSVRRLNTVADRCSPMLMQTVPCGNNCLIITK